jgi:hypothetical protein
MVLVLVQIVLLGVATRDAASFAKRFCNEHPVGSAIDPDALAQQQPWLRVTPPRDPGDPTHIEAEKGAFLRVFRCTLEVRARKVTSALYQEER